MVPGKNPIYGGGTVGISKNSRRKEDAFAFIKWITTEPAASGMAALGSVSPCAKTYNKYDIIPGWNYQKTVSANHIRGEFLRIQTKHLMKSSF